MTRHEQEQAIAKDLDLCDLIDALGTKSAKRKAKAQRAACYVQIKAWNDEDGPPWASDAELMAELMS